MYCTRNKMETINLAINESIKQLQSGCITYISPKDTVRVSNINILEEINRVTIPAMVCRSILRAISEHKVIERNHILNKYIAKLLGISRTLIDYLNESRVSDYIWNYYPRNIKSELPNDIDDTSLAIESLAIYYNNICPDTSKCSNIRNAYAKTIYDQIIGPSETTVDSTRELAVNKAKIFRYSTWLTKHPEWVNIDPIVNANVSSASLRLGIPDFIPTEYLIECFENNICESDFYCSNNIFHYALSPYLETINIAMQLEEIPEQDSLLSREFGTIARLRGKQDINTVDIRNIIEISKEIISLKTSGEIEALYIEKVREKDTSYSMSPSVYYALFIELISLCNTRLIGRYDKP